MPMDPVLRTNVTKIIQDAHHPDILYALMVCQSSPLVLVVSRLICCGETCADITRSNGRFGGTAVRFVLNYVGMRAKQPYGVQEISIEAD